MVSWLIIFWSLFVWSWWTQCDRSLFGLDEDTWLFDCWLFSDRWLFGLDEHTWLLKFFCWFSTTTISAPAPAPAPDIKMKVTGQHVTAHIAKIEQAVRNGLHTGKIKAVMKDQHRALVSEKTFRITLGLIHSVEHIICMARTESRGGCQCSIQCQGILVALPAGMGKFGQIGRRKICRSPTSNNEQIRWEK